jgi:cell division protein FtsZ
MGKAMMGTGEATGEKRALTAAEAAIANPLIDDSSMKGARGLLISITGGKDLTLFEVDEAATRIREEVDQDANIIVGATFDEGLDGVIRVSVVATGIEHANFVRPGVSTHAAPTSHPTTLTGGPENRLADLTARLRADNARLAERAAKLEAQPHAPAAQRPSNNVERAALAAIAAAVAPDAPAASAPVTPATYGDVSVRPIAQKPSLFPDHDPAHKLAEEPSTPETFIPPAAERAQASRAPRMPKFEDLPMPAQAEIRQARGDSEEEEHPQKNRLSLLQRLANVGLGRRDEEAEPPIAARAAGPAMPPLPERKPKRAEPSTDPVSEYARRPAPHGLDSHGRPAPVAPAPQGDDHLDIPAFLRRQAN